MCFSSACNRFHAHFVPSGSFPGSPAFLGYFAEIGFIFLILIRLLDPSPPGSSTPVTLPEPVLLQYLLIYKEQNIPPPLQMAYNILIKRTD